MHKKVHFEVGDKVRVHPEGLKRHSHSVPAHMGYSTAQFKWRKILSDLQDEGAIGEVERVFSGAPNNLNVRFGKTLLGVPARMVEKVHDNPKKSKRTRKRKMNPAHYPHKKYTSLEDALTTLNNRYGRGDIKDIYFAYDAPYPKSGYVICRLQYGSVRKSFTVDKVSGKLKLKFLGKSVSLTTSPGKIRK